VNFSGQFNYFFRRSPLFRTFCFFVAVVFVLLSVFFISYKLKRIPSINDVNPPIGSPGDIVIITGKNFGNIRGPGYVEFGGSRLTATSYISWNDNEIKVVLPANVQDGLVIVGTDTARSRPSFFANERDIPVAVPPDPGTSLPVVTTLSGDTFRTGDLLVISGSNFGNMHDGSGVYFATVRDDTSNPATTALPFSNTNLSGLRANHIPANKTDFDYEYWSDTEIRVRIPDGATSGMMYVETAKGDSALQKITIESKTGGKKFLSRRTYLLQLAANISDVVPDKSSTIKMYFPRPVCLSSQPLVEMTECIPEPAISDYQDTVIHQLQGGKPAASGKKQFSENFVVSVYEINTSVKPEMVTSYANMNNMLYTAAIRADKCVPAGDSEIISLSKKITGKEANPYKKAKLIYDYMLDNYSLQTVKSSSSSALDLIKRKKGDAYDFAVIYTALLRASGIPSLTDSGVLVDRDMKTKNHWWSEFYVCGIGWIPVDPALGAGLSYKSWTETGDVREYYFGNLDSQHITFSRGWKEIKPGAGNLKIVQRPRSYALQSIWEESSHDTLRYSSFWADPVVLGIY
jgi:transglutaminase-like putative cysteine protease